jgi:hypothetical protein
MGVCDIYKHVGRSYAGTSNLFLSQQILLINVVPPYAELNPERNVYLQCFDKKKTCHVQVYKRHVLWLRIDLPVERQK